MLFDGWVALVGLGAVLAIDGTAVGQFMIARPLVAGVLAGAVLGDAPMGLYVGCLLELFFLPTIPVGGVRVPESGPATVIAAAAGVWGGGAGGVALAVCFGLLFSVVGGATQERLRGAYQLALPRPGDADLVERLARMHWFGVSAEAARGAVVTAIGLLLVGGLSGPFVAIWPLGSWSTALLLILCAMVPLGSLLATLGGVRRQGAWLGAGLAAGSLVGGLL